MSNVAVVQYGFRDDDDDSDYDGKRRSRRSILADAMNSSNRSFKKLGRVINETKTLLKGANMSYNNDTSLYGLGLDDSDEESDDDSDDSSSYESESDDDASVCSKSSVASKASQTLKKLGGTLKRTSILVKGKRRSSTEATAASEANHHHKNTCPSADEDLSDDDDDDDCSVRSSSSRASAVKRVSVKISKALAVVKPKRRSSKDPKGSTGLDLEFDLDYSNISVDSCELFNTMEPNLYNSGGRKGPDDRAPTTLRRTTSAGGPRDVAPTRQTPRRHTSVDPAVLPKQKHHDEPQRRALSSSNHTKKNNASIYNNNWAMNVTPEMLEQAQKQAATSGGGATSSNFPLNVLLDKNGSKVRAA